MKITREEIYAAVRLNDASADLANGESFGIENMGVDMEAAQYVAMQRSKMILAASPEITPNVGAASALAAMWFDGFFAALHVIEQKGDLGS